MLVRDADLLQISSHLVDRAGWWLEVRGAQCGSARNHHLLFAGEDEIATNEHPQVPAVPLCGSSSQVRIAVNHEPATRSENRVAVASRGAETDCPSVKLAARIASVNRRPGTRAQADHVERFMFLQQQVTHWESTFRARKTDTIDSVLRDYRDATARANSVIEAWDDLSLAAPRRVTITSAPSRRWVLTHMIEETGRHAGHLDILRELFDGQTGR